jgi:hypothetical protein
MVILTYGLSIAFAVEPPLLPAGLAALGIVLVVWLARRPSWTLPDGAVAPRRIVE